MARLYLVTYSLYLVTHSLYLVTPALAVEVDHDRHGLAASFDARYCPHGDNEAVHWRHGAALERETAAFLNLLLRRHLLGHSVDVLTSNGV